MTNIAGGVRSISDFLVKGIQRVSKFAVFTKKMS